MGRGGWLLLRHAAAARRQRHAPEGALHGGVAALCAPRPSWRRCSGNTCRVPSAISASACAGCRNCWRPFTRPGRAISAWRTRHSALVNPDRLRRILSRMLDENEFLSPHGIRSLSRYHADHPYVFDVRRAGVSGGLPAGGIRHRHVRRQLQLARAGLDAGQRADHPRAAALLSLLRRQFQDRMPHRFRQADESV